MNKRFDIRVVATDGAVTKKILWICGTKKHICYGWDVPENIGHFTYHQSGKVHYKRNNKILGDVIQKISLSNFKGKIQVGNGGFNRNLSGLPNVDFDYKKVDGLVWIDIRTIKQSKKDSCNIDFQLVEPGRKDLIYQWPGHRSIHIFTFVQPWVVISAE